MSIFDSPLIQDQTVTCKFMTKTITFDTVGGYGVKWVPGVDFDAVITENSSLEATIAGLEKEKTMYGVKVKKELPLEHNMVFIRVKDQKTFRITTAEGMKAPDISALGMKCLQAEEYVLTENDDG